jgi:hypothetical protein
MAMTFKMPEEYNGVSYYMWRMPLQLFQGFLYYVGAL